MADGNDAVVRDLAAHGADLNARGPKGDTLLTFAVFYWPERVPLLLDFGADPISATARRPVRSTRPS